jgi:Protein of unknown function DUF262
MSKIVTGNPWGDPSTAHTAEELLLFEEADDDRDVADEAENEPHLGSRFTITSYGADLSVFDLRRRLGKEILIPAPFQRKFVWTPRQASRFIESILMGLPVPGIFVFLKDKKQLIVDGQQRLITLDRFTSGVWDRRIRKQGAKETEIVTPFALTDVAEPWSGKTWNDLSKDDQDQIDNYLVHVTIFRQDRPKVKDRSIYEVFERINTGGLRLSSQEIRTCISHGNFVQKLHDLAGQKNWRSVYGNRSPRLKDEELILRYFAFLERRDIYKRPMAAFLDEYLDNNKNISEDVFYLMANRFSAVLDLLIESIGEKKIFRPESAINAAVFDSVMVGCSLRLKKGNIKNKEEVRSAYQKLLSNGDFKKYYQRATADEENVDNRMKLSIEAFDAVK